MKVKKEREIREIEKKRRKKGEREITSPGSSISPANSAQYPRMQVPRLCRASFYT